MHINRLLLLGALILIAVVALSFSETTANSNCKERPRKLIKTAKSCCAIPTPHFENFTEQCAILENENATIFCKLECLFNASNALEAQNLNLAKLHRLLDQVFPESAHFVAAYYVSYEECISLVKNALKLREGVKHKCAPTATLYAACAQMKLLKHCPTTAWNSTELCQRARNYVIKCADNLLLYRKKSSSIKLDEQKQFEAENGNLNNTTLPPKIDEITAVPENDYFKKNDMKNETYF